MAINLSASSFVIISLSVIALILGTILLLNLTVFSEEVIETDLPTPYQDDIVSQSTRIDVEVTPSTSQEGTVFAVVADTWPSVDFQDLEVTIEKDDQQIPLTLYDDGQHQDGEANDGKFGALLDTQNFALGKYKIKDANSKELSEFTLQDSKCEALVGSPAYEKINFLIIPYGYTDVEVFREEAENILLGKNTLSEIEPFKSNFRELSFSFVEPLEDLECQVGCKGIETMVCCNDAKVAQTASQCHYDGLIVLIDNPSTCGTASFYTKLCAKSDSAGLIFAHEIGHAFGGLADEYTYADYFDYSIPENFILEMPNCDVEGCPKWANTTSDCFEGCTSPNLYRSSRNSIMRYISSGAFNEVSRQNLRDEIQRRTQAESQMHQENPQWKSYYVNLDYSDGEVKLSPTTIRPVKPGLLSVSGSLTAVLKDENSAVLYETKIPLPLIEFPALEISEKPIINTQVSLPITLPFVPNAKKLEISDNEKVLAVTSLAIFTDRCGDGTCQPSENHVNCEKDCAPETDNFCESASCDPDCPDFEECSSQTQEKNFLWPILLIAIPIILIAIIVLRAKKN
jgi:hypothetical protein